MNKEFVAGSAIRAGPDELRRFLEPSRRVPLGKLVPVLEPLTGARVLDVGCGIGRLLRAVTRRGAAPAGLERAGALVEIARWALPDADLRLGELDALPFEDNAFDVVTAFDVLHEAEEHDAALAELRRVTDHGGRIAIGHWGRRTAPHPAGLAIVAEDHVDCADGRFHYIIATPVA